MPVVTFVLPDGSHREVNVLRGASVMSGAVQGGIRQILAECGGSCACATCHVYVDPACIGLLPEKSGLEGELLDAVAAEGKDNSRLSCQIMVTPELDGQLIFHLPDRQC